MHVRTVARLAISLLVGAAHAPAAVAQAAPVVDWTTIDVAARTATGTLDGNPVTLVWNGTGNVSATYFGGNAPWLNGMAFTPPFASTEGMEILARRADQGVPSYTITFASPVTNPVLHLGSLASTFAFSGATPLRVSGDERFQVGGTAVSGSDFNEPNGIDANGTITFPGSYTSLTFTAQYSGTAPNGADGVTIQVGGMPGSRLVGLEVVQVIQDWRNSVPLVAAKPTVVRAHLSRSAEPPPTPVEPQLWAFDAQGQPMNPPFILNGPDRMGEPYELPWLVNETTRATLAASVNFYLPEEWVAAGARTFLFRFAQGVQPSCAEFAPPILNDCAVSVEFVARQPIVMQLLRTQFQDTESTPADCAATGGQYVAGICTYMTRGSDLALACNRIRTEMPTHEVECRTDKPPIFFAPRAERPTTFEINNAVVLLKRADCSGCGVFYMAITAFASQSGALGASYPPGLNSDLYRTGWARAVSQSPGTVVHELGHSFGLDHPSFDDANPGDDIKEGTCGEVARKSHHYPPFDSYFFPFYEVDSSGNRPRLGPILENDMELRVYGYDTRAKLVVSYATSALMGYCRDPGLQGRWHDLGSYGFLFDALVPVAATSGAKVSSNVDGYFWVSGNWNRENDVAEFDPVERVTPPVAPSVPSPGVFELVIHSSAAPDVVQPLASSFLHDDPNQFKFSGWVAWSPDVTGFTLRRNGVVLAQTQVSAHSPQIAITGPAPGGIYIGDDVTLAWTASDMDGDPLTFRVEYSIDGGATWEMLSSGWPSSPFVVNADLLRDSSTARFRVTALDGFLSATATMNGTITLINSVIFDSGFE